VQASDATGARSRFTVTEIIKLNTPIGSLVTQDNKSSMDGQRHTYGAPRKRRRAKHNGTPKAEPILIAARRPDAPPARPPRRLIAASASPRNNGAKLTSAASLENGNGKPLNGHSRNNGTEVGAIEAQRRAARIVQVNASGPDDREKQRLRLIERLLTSEGRVSISRAANDLRLAGFDFPLNQDVLLQLLEHNDEALARQAVVQLKTLLESERPIKLPVFSQRLRRLEEVGEDPQTRKAAADLRRQIRA
jgi:hypothetical protein